MLPPGVSRADFAAAIAAFQKAIGRDWVFTSDEDVALYRDAYSPLWGEPEERLASAAVAPASVEEVQQIVRIAGRYKIPLYPVSTGMNLTYGGSAPTYSGSVVVELKRMNRILEVNEAGAYALVEPGVSYFDMYRYLRDNRIKLWVDCPDPGWGSLLGNAMDRGGGYTMADFRDHFDAHCGMEVVLANGEIVRTGMGAVPGAHTWQEFKYGMGPWVDGIFSQSNYGIVTKMGFWMMPEPEAALQVTVESPRHDDVHAHVEILSNLMYQQIIPSQSGVQSPALGGPMNDELYGMRTRAGGWPSAAEWDRYAKSKSRNFWRSNFTFYGPEKVIAAQWEHVRDRFGAAIPGAVFTERARFKFPLSDAEVDKVADKAPLGIPSLALFGTRFGPGDAPREAHIDFSPVMPRTGESMLKGLDVFGRVFAAHGQPPPGAIGALYHPRALIMIQPVINGRDAETNGKARALFTALVDTAAKNGWAEYRIHPIWQRQAMAVYGANNGSLHKLHETLKDALDPAGILSPGRYDIWPKHLRGARR
jgi:4-cresol dehydrogenase (hydroxylating)